MHNNILLWLKLETGGLASVTDGDRSGSSFYPIFEVNAVVTDMDLNEIGSIRKAIYQDEDIIKLSHPDALTMHSQNGLLSEVEDSGYYLADVEREVINLLTQSGAEPFNNHACAVAILAGQNIYNHELQFITDQMPTLKRFLHYSVFDVSTLMLSEVMWTPEAAQERLAYTDWSDDSPKAKVSRMIQNAKYYRGFFDK